MCNFNQHFKTDPATFKTWTDAMSLMSREEKHPPTMWMLAGNAVSHRNLRREFVGAGLREDQLVFAARRKVTYRPF